MRFRMGLGSSGNIFDQQQSGGGGFGRAIQTLGMLPVAQAQAAEQYQDGEAKRALAASQIRQSDAHAALYGQQAEEARTQLQRGTLPEMIRTAALVNKVPLHQLPEFTEYAQTGKLPSMYVPPTDGMGPVAPAPEYADPNGVGGQIMRTLGLMQGGLAAGDKNIDNVAQAEGRYQHQDAVRDVLANPGNAGRTGQAFAASEGKPLVENIASTGRGFNKFTGQGGTLDAGLSVLFDRGENAEIGQRNAAATNSLASAGQHRASERKTLQDLEQGARTGHIALVTGTDGVVTAVDKRTLQVTPLVGADGRPVVRGSAASGGKPMTEGQAKANLFGGRMFEADAVLNQLEDKGTYFPGQVKSAAEGIGGAVPIIGDSLREGAGNLMNRAPTYLGGPNANQQSVEQARRDFINAVLRRESGAAIAPSEFTNADKQYFPQPGDSKQVLEQKRRNRQIATNLMLQEVPEVHRYKPKAAGAPPPADPVAPEGSWGGSAPTGRNVQVNY